MFNCQMNSAIKSSVFAPAMLDDAFGFSDLVSEGAEKIMNFKSKASNNVARMSPLKMVDPVLNSEKQYIAL